MNIRRLHLCLMLAVCLLPLAIQAADSLPQWTDSGASFAGTLGNSGQNLYINRHGELETIRRYDLDGNGHLDLLFNSTHDSYHAVSATLATAAHDRKVLARELTVDGSSQVIQVDLNRDGFADLVFMPNQQNVQAKRSSILIAWGAADGWSNDRLTRQLPVNDVRSCAVGDLNGDDWPDIITVNSEGWLFGQPKGKIIRVYWGSRQGFLLTKYQDLGIEDALQVVTGRFGPGAAYPAAVLTTSGVQYLAPEAVTGELRIARAVALQHAIDSASTGPAAAVRFQYMVPQTPDQIGPEALWISTNSSLLFRLRTTEAGDDIQASKAFPASHLASGHLNSDNWPDLVLTNVKLIPPLEATAIAAFQPAVPSVHILWGDADGYKDTRSTALTIPNAIAATIGDLDRDGLGDLIVAVHQGDKTKKAASLVYFGERTARFTQGTVVETEGASDVVLAQLNAKAEPVAVFANSQRRTLDEAVPLRLYWGSSAGFSTSSMAEIPNKSGYKSSASDLNGDGFVDLIVIDGGDVGREDQDRDPSLGAVIYWGGPTGSIKGPGPNHFDPARRQVLREFSLGSINVADLNHDGYLDLVLGAFESAGVETDLVIYYGSPEGYRVENRKAIRVPGRSIGCLIADFNRDGYLEIVVGCYNTNKVITYWGGIDGYSNGNKMVLPYPAPIDLEAADLNNDGWLDLLVPSYVDSVAHHHDTGLTIFWGGTAGWRQSNSQWLPGMTPLGLAVADLDADGFLDIVSPHYHGELSREHLPSYIFWGSAKGYTPLNRTSLTVDSASEVVAADFNGDGRLDLAFVAHSVDPGHILESPIYFNDGNRFRSPHVQYLPVTGPHYMWVQDIGNIYHRRYEENFPSRLFSWKDSCHDGRLVVDATTPFGAHPRLHVRSAANETALALAPWRELAGVSFETAPEDRILQYRLDLLSANGDAYPIVRKVDIFLK